MSVVFADKSSVDIFLQLLIHLRILLVYACRLIGRLTTKTYFVRGLLFRFTTALIATFVGFHPRDNIAVSTDQSRRSKVSLYPQLSLSTVASQTSVSCFIGRDTLHPYGFEKDYLLAPPAFRSYSFTAQSFLFSCFSQKHIYIIQRFWSLVKKFLTN